MAMDWSKPALADSYTSFAQGIRDNLAALATMFDSGIVSHTGTPVTGAKRINATSGLFEQWNGSSWTSTSMGYAKKAGDTFTGAVSMQARLSVSEPSGLVAWFDSTHTSGGYIQFSNSSSFIGFVGAGQQLFSGGAKADLAFRTEANMTWGVSNVQKMLLSSSGNLNIGYSTDQGWRLAVAGNAFVSGLISSNSGEAFRVVHSSGFISGYNSAGTVRSGYIQFTAGGHVYVMNDLNNGVILGTNGVARIEVDNNGIYPALNNTYYCGLPSWRWANVYSVGGNFSSDVTISGGVNAAAAGIAFGALYTDTVNGAPSIGVGRTSTDLFSGGGNQLQVAGYYGVRVRTQSLAFDLNDNTDKFQLFGGDLEVNGRAYTVSNNQAFSATPTFNARTTNLHILGVMTASVTSVTVSNAVEGQFITIRFKQDGTGGRTVTTGNMGATNAPLISGSVNTGANKVSYLNLTYSATDLRFEGTWTNL